MQPTRRAVLSGMAAMPALAAGTPAVDPAVIRRHDERVEGLLKSQITDPTHRSCGALAAPLPQPGGAGAILEGLAAAFLYPGSKFHRDRLLPQRMRLAVAYLERGQSSADGNIDLPTTNFNSPPDTAFVVNPVATAASLALGYGAGDLLKMMEPFLRRAGGGMATGGIHTPNHRWVLCGALAQLYALFPEPAWLRRIDQWLSEGIDIDEDGQYTERSTLAYNVHINRSLITMAAKLKRPELLQPVRRNLESLLYLLHPGYEVVTEISRRQDVNTRGDAGRYWFALRYLAVHDRNGRFAGLADHFAPAHATLPALMEYPELAGDGPAHAALPEEFEKLFPAMQVARIRRGPTSATLVLGGNSRFFTLRRGDAVINAVRFASAFFGKSQFVPQTAEKRGESYFFAQSLTADYMQPTDPPQRVGTGDWEAVKRYRRRTETCRLEQSATVTELRNGFRVRLQAHGTNNVPLAVEINLREGGSIEGCTPVAEVAGALMLAAGHCTYRTPANGIRFGPGRREHDYVEVRGAQPKLLGPSVYLTGYTPFDHTLLFEWT